MTFLVSFFAGALMGMAINRYRRRHGGGALLTVSTLVYMYVVLHLCRIHLIPFLFLP